jgi:hypothetical protein
VITVHTADGDRYEIDADAQRIAVATWLDAAGRHQMIWELDEKELGEVIARDFDRPERDRDSQRAELDRMCLGFAGESELRQAMRDARLALSRIEAGEGADDGAVGAAEDAALDAEDDYYRAAMDCIATTRAGMVAAIQEDACRDAEVITVGEMIEDGRDLGWTLSRILGRRDVAFGIVRLADEDES